VVHGGGAGLVTVSQKQNGGQWNLLGTYSFAAAGGEEKKVEGEKEPEED
jgi:hypothetical protein